MQPSRDLMKILGKGTALAFLRGSQALFGMLTAIMMSRGMTDSALSTALFLLSITLNSGRVGVLGFDVILVKMLGRKASDDPETHAHYADLLARFLAVWAVIILVAGGVGLMLPQNFLGRALGVPFSWVVAWLFLAALQIFLASVLLGFHRQVMSLLAMGALSSFVAFALVAYQVTIMGGIDVAGVAKAYLIGISISNVFTLVMVVRTIGRIMPRRTKGESVSWRTLGGSATINALAIIVTQFPFWIIVSLGTDAEAVSYGLAFRLMLPLSIILLSARTMVSTIVSRAWHQGTIAAVEPRLRQIATAVFLVTFALSVMLLGLHSWIFSTLFHRSGEDAFTALLWLLLSQNIAALFGQGQLVLRLTDQHTMALRISLVTSAIQGVFGYALFLGFGIAGAALSVTIFALVECAISNYFVQKAIGLRIHATLPFRQNKKGRDS